MPLPTDPCPCGRLAPAGPGGSKGKSATPLAFARCCGRYLAAPGLEASAAPDAESLMRSRYTAFVCEQADYLQATWHASTRPADVEFDAGVKWLGLEVRQHMPVDADHAEFWLLRYIENTNFMAASATSRAARAAELRAKQSAAILQAIKVPLPELVTTHG